MVQVDTGQLELDVCKVCQFVWFDPQEYEQVPGSLPLQNPAKPVKRDKLKEAIAIRENRLLAEQAGETPDCAWKYVPALFGLPVECESKATRAYPLATWVVAATVAIISLACLPKLREAIALYGLIPSEALRMGGATFITSFFIHGGFIHLLGNLYFLLIFGDDVEEHIGSKRWLALLMGATLAGNIAHFMINPSTSRPCIGASGGIAGLLAFYALQFPQRRLAIIVPRLAFRWVPMHAWVAFVVWVLFQLIGLLKQLSGFSNVSAIAHLGGAAAGVVAWRVWRARPEAQGVATIEDQVLH